MYFIRDVSDVVSIVLENTLVFKHFIQEGNNTKSICIFCLAFCVQQRRKKLLGIKWHLYIVDWEFITNKR